MRLVKTKMKNSLVLFLVSFVFTSCTSTKTAFVKGADIGWLPQMEATGYTFYDQDGTKKECLQLLKDRGMNSVRLRVWVNPNTDKASGHCSKEETVAMAIRAQKMGMRVMINFHYSDSWADPAKQFKPKAWENHSFPELLNDVYNHTFEVISALKIAGVTPEWVQIGNEIPGGFLFPEGEVPAPIGSSAGPLEAIGIPMKDFMSLTKIPIVIYYGDNIPEKPSPNPGADGWRARLAMAKLWRDTVNKYGGDVTVIHLPEVGLKGNTHFPFSDLNNLQVADLMSKWLKNKGLD